MFFIFKNLQSKFHIKVHGAGLQPAGKKRGLRSPAHFLAAFLTILLILVTISADAQVTRADYERAFELKEKWQYLTSGVAEPASWIGATHRFYYRKTVPGGHQYIMADAETLAKRPAFDHVRLAEALSKVTGEPAAPERLPLVGLRFTDDGRSIHINVGMVPWEGQWYTCSLDDYVLSPFERRTACQPRGFGVVRDLEIPADNTPRRSPDGKWEVFIHNHNLALRSTSGGPMTVLSTDGSEGNFYDPCSIAWSPDSQKIAVFRVQPGYRRLVHYIASSPEDQLQPKHFTRLYPKPGDVVDWEQPVIFHIDAESPRHINVADDLFPNPLSLSQPEWRPDSRTLTFNYTQRGHKVFRVIEVDAVSGQARAVISEEPETFNGQRWFRHEIDSGREIIWLSERDGWHQLYLIEGATGRVKNRITNGEWVVRGIQKVDEEKRQIWFSASGMYPGKDPYFVQYYRINFDGSGLTALTEADANHDVSYSADMKFYVDTYSRVDLPTVSELRRAEDGSLVTVLEEADVSALSAAGWKPPEVFTAKGRDGKTDIWGVIVRPTNFDPSKSYPVIENIYAGPHGSFVPKSFWPFELHSSGDSLIGMQAHAEVGFIVVMIDGMGTFNRSKAFHDVAWKNVGDAGFPDRILWHKAVAEKYPYYDISRVGIYGGSAGGQNSTGALLFHPDFYDAAVSYVGCHDNRMDKIGWNERWMGWPVDDSYAESSNVDNAWRLKGKLLLVLGELDQNVDPSSTMQVADALIKAGKMFDLLVIPGWGHGAGRTVGPVKYCMKKQYDYFVRHLHGEEPPDWNK
ncbi:MAG: DPP IV N-terminal domain-containing protein [Desulfobacterales bacterium]